MDIGIAFVVVVLVLIVLDVLRRRGMDPIGSVGRALTAPMDASSVALPAPASTESAPA